jgi:hypothetical protein
MSTEDEHAAVRNVLDGFDEDRTAPALLLHQVSVMHDFMVHVNRSAIGFQRQLDDVHRANHSGTKAAGANP